MTIYNFTDGSIAGQPKPHDTTPRGYSPFILRNVVDFSLQNIANDGSSALVLNVPAGTMVLAAWIRVITVDAGGATLSFGVTGTDATRWGATLAISAAGYIETTLTFDAPLYFGSADTIDILEDGAAAITTLKCEVSALCIDVGDTIDAEE